VRLRGALLAACVGLGGFGLTSIGACSNPTGSGGATTTMGNATTAASSSKTSTHTSATGTANGGGGAGGNGTVTNVSSSASGTTCGTPHCLDWVRIFDGNPGTLGPPSMAVDASNNTWVLGSLTGSANFGIHTLSTVKKAPLLVELGPYGDALRADLIGANDEAFFMGMARSKAGPFFAFGIHRANVDFGNGVTLTAVNVYNTFLVAYDASGKAKWVRDGDIQPFAIAADGAGSVLLAGNAGHGTFDGHSLVGPPPSAGFVMKYDSAGTWQWTTLLGSTQTEFVFAAATDSANDIVVGDNDVSTYGFVTVKKLDHTTGTVVWSVPVPTPYSVGKAQTAAIDASNTAHLAGFQVAGPDGHGGWVGPPFLFDVDTNGSPVLADSLLLQKGDGQQWASSMALDGGGHVAMTGAFGGTLDLDVPITATGAHEIFFAVLSEGAPPTPSWGRRVGGTAYDVNTGDGQQNVAYDTAGNLLLATDFGGTADFGAGPTTPATRSLAIAKYKP